MQITEQGSHGQLIRLGGIYANLVARQRGREPSDQDLSPRHREHVSKPVASTSMDSVEPSLLSRSLGSLSTSVDSVVQNDIVPMKLNTSTASTSLDAACQPVGSEVMK